MPIADEEEQKQDYLINCEELDQMFLQIEKLEVVDNVESPRF